MYFSFCSERRAFMNLVFLKPYRWSKSRWDWETTVLEGLDL